MNTPKPGPGVPKGQKLVRNDGVKKIQALAMMREIALGKSVQDVAKQFNTSQNIVRARLSYAQRAGLFTHHEDVILTSMVPLAQNVLVGVLDPRTPIDPELKVKVALEVFKGTGLLRKPGTAAPAALQGTGKKAQATLEDYINSLRNGNGELPEGEAVDAEYSITGQSESLALTSGGNEPASEEQADSGSADGLHGHPSEAPSEGTGKADQAFGHGFTTLGTFVSAALGQGPREARGENRSEHDSHTGDEAGSGPGILPRPSEEA